MPGSFLGVWECGRFNWSTLGLPVWEVGRFPAPPSYLSRYPKYGPIEPKRPLIEVSWGGSLIRPNVTTGPYNVRGPQWRQDVYAEVCRASRKSKWKVSTNTCELACVWLRIENLYMRHLSVLHTPRVLYTCIILILPDLLQGHSKPAEVERV